MAAQEFRIETKVTGAPQAAAEFEKIATSAAKVKQEVASGGGLGSVFGDFGGIASKLSVAAGGAFAITAALKTVAEAAAESEAAAVRLEAALDAAGQSGDGAAERIDALASNYQRFTNVSDETWSDAAAKLLQFGLSVKEIENAFPVVEGLAGRMGNDVVGAAELFGRVMAGNTRGLAQFGVKLDDAATKAERFAGLQQAAAAGAGQMRAQVETLGGSWEKFKMGLGDVAEGVGGLINSGGWIAPTLGNIGQQLSFIGTGNWFGVTTGGAAHLARQVGNVAAGMPALSLTTKAAAIDMAALAKEMEQADQKAGRLLVQLNAIDSARADKGTQEVNALEAAGVISQAEAKRRRAVIDADKTKGELERKAAPEEDSLGKLGAARKEAAGRLATAQEKMVPGSAESMTAIQSAAQAVQQIDEQIAERARTLEALRIQMQASELKLNNQLVAADQEEEAAAEKAKQAGYAANRSPIGARPKGPDFEKIEGANDEARGFAAEGVALGGRSTEATGRLKEAAGKLNDGATARELSGLAGVLESLDSSLRQKNSAEGQARAAVAAKIRALEATVARLESNSET